MGSPADGPSTPADPATRVRDLVAPLVAALDLELYDVEHGGGVLRVVVDRPGGVDLEALGEVTRLVSVTLDDADPLPGRYTLEVSSPGLERRLRTPEHFLAAVGEDVAVKTAPDVEGDRRCDGTLVAADADGITIRTDAGDERRLAYDQVRTARTRFEWGPAPKPGGGSGRRSGGAAAGAPTHPTTSSTKAAPR